MTRYILLMSITLMVGHFFLGCASTQAPTIVPNTNDIERGYDPNWKPDNSNSLDYFFDGASSISQAISLFLIVR